VSQNARRALLLAQAQQQRERAAAIVPLLRVRVQRLRRAVHWLELAIEAPMVSSAVVLAGGWLLRRLLKTWRNLAAPLALLRMLAKLVHGALDATGAARQQRAPAQPRQPS
jgi:hypothetical protein